MTSSLEESNSEDNTHELHENQADVSSDAQSKSPFEQWAKKLDSTTFFSTLFDFKFTKYLTRKLARSLYIVGLIVIGIEVLTNFTYSLNSAVESPNTLSAYGFLFDVIFSLVRAAFSILILRVAIEVGSAVTEIAYNTRVRHRHNSFKK